MSACSAHVYVTCAARDRARHVAAPHSPTNLYINNPATNSFPVNSFSNFTKNNRKFTLAVVPKMSSNDNSYRAGEAKGQAQAKTEQALGAIKDTAVGAKDQAGAYIEGAKNTVLDTAQAAKEQVAGAAQATWDAAEAGKNKTGEILQSAGVQIKGTADGAGKILQSTGEQIKGTAEGAAEGVKNTFGTDEK